MLLTHMRTSIRIGSMPTIKLLAHPSLIAP